MQYMHVLGEGDYVTNMNVLGDGGGFLQYMHVPREGDYLTIHARPWGGGLSCNACTSLGSEFELRIKAFFERNYI